MYLQLDDYHPYYDALSDNFESNMNNNLRYCHCYTINAENKPIITWVPNIPWEMLYSEFPSSQVIITRPRNIISNYCDQNIVSCDVLDYGGNVDVQ